MSTFSDGKPDFFFAKRKGFDTKGTCELCERNLGLERVQNAEGLRTERQTSCISLGVSLMKRYGARRHAASGMTIGSELDRILRHIVTEFRYLETCGIASGRWEADFCLL